MAQIKEYTISPQEAGLRPTETGIEATAFIDQSEECITIDTDLALRGLVAVLEIAANVTNAAANAHN